MHFKNSDIQYQPHRLDILPMICGSPIASQLYNSMSLNLPLSLSLSGYRILTHSLPHWVSLSLSLYVSRYLSLSFPFSWMKRFCSFASIELEIQRVSATSRHTINRQTRSRARARNTCLLCKIACTNKLNWIAFDRIGYQIQ